MFKQALSRIVVKPACDVEAGDVVPDQFGYLHSVLMVGPFAGRIRVQLSNGAEISLRRATRVHCIVMVNR